MTTNWKLNTDNNYKSSFHTFDWEPVMILELGIMEYKRLFSIEGYTICTRTVL